MNCDSAGRYSVPLPPGAHAVSDWTFDPDRCALSPAVTPAPNSVPGASHPADFTTTGCILFRARVGGRRSGTPGRNRTCAFGSGGRHSIR